MNPSNIDTELDKLCEDSAARIMEHADSVRIFVTHHDGAGDETLTISVGKGNFHAQLGQITEWLTIQQEHQRQYARKNK